MALTFREQTDQVLDITKSAVNTDRYRVGRVINDVGADVVQRLVTPIKTSAVVTLQNLVPDYDLTASPFSLTDFIQLRDVLYMQGGNSPTRTLRQVTPHEIYQQRNQTYSGFLYGFAMQGMSTLMLAPSPSTGDTLQIVYNYRPLPLAVDSDTWTLLPDEDVDCIIVGAAYRVCRWKNPQLGAQLVAEYNRLLDIAVARQNRKGGTSDHTMRLLPMRRRPPHDNSTDTGSWY